MADLQVRVVGFDCAEEEHVAVLLDEAGAEARRLTVTNRRDRVQECLAELMLVAGSGVKLVVVVESKRSHGRLVALEASRLGCDVVQVNTVALNHFRAVEGQPRKDDAWDAFLAARMSYLRVGGCQQVVEISDQECGLSRLTRMHERLVRDRTRHVYRFRALLLELAPEILQKSWEGPKPDSKALTYILQRWPGFEGLERAQLRSIETILHSCRYGDKAHEMAKLMRDLARRISVASGERTALTLELESVLSQIAAYDASLGKVLAEVKRRVEDHPIGAKLVEMDGIGHITAGVLVSELLPVARTTTEAKSATYAGVTPLGRKSGKSLDRPRLTRGVNKRVLRALYTSSVASISHSAVDRAYYDKKRRGYAAHPKPHVAAIIALARQRHKVIFKLMTTNAHYRKETLFAAHLARLEHGQSAVA